MNNDHDLFLRFYEEFKNKLFNYLMYRLSFDRELAEDLLMDIVLKAYENFDSYNKKKGSFKSWIFTIAHNHLLNYWRDQNKRGTVDIEKLEFNEMYADDGQIVKNADKKIEADYIKRVFEIMNNTNSELLILKYIHDFNNKEIAKILKKRQGTIRTAISRAVKEFKEIYNKLYNKR